MTGAIGFLRKAKAICKEEYIDCETTFLFVNYLSGMKNALSESDLVRKVMDYRLEDKDGRDIKED